MSADGSERDRRASQPQITETFNPKQGERESAIAGDTAKSDAFDLRGTVCITCGAILDPAYQSTQATCPRCRPTRAPVPAPRVANRAANALDKDGDARATVRSKREERLPTHVARFSILGELGTGGYGRVYRAYDPNMSKEVALKVPRREKFSSESEYHDYLEEFRSEGAKLSRLIHPGIVRVYECGDFDDGNGAYISMELMEGGSLSRHQAPDRRLTSPQVAGIMSRVAEALHFAHLTGFLHRDIKPANILLDKNGRPKLSDFGLAIEEDDQLWRRGLREGTLPYMAPEQVAARVPHMDGRADIWSLGVIIYVLLAGRLPFEGVDQEDLCDAIANKPFRPLSQRDSKIPAIFDEILGRCLSKTVEGRYVTALELSNALRMIERRANLKLLLAAGGGASVIGLASAIVAMKPRMREEDPIEIQVGTGRWVALPLTRPKRIHPPVETPRVSFDDKNRRIEARNSDHMLIGMGNVVSKSWRMSVTIDVSQMSEGNAGLFFGYRPNNTNRKEHHYQWCGITLKNTASNPAGFERRIMRRVAKIVTEEARFYREVDVARSKELMLPERLQTPNTLELTIEIRGGFVDRISVDKEEFGELVNSESAQYDKLWVAFYGAIGLIKNGTNGVFQDCQVFIDS